MKGKVLWFDEALGYGYIKSEEGEELYFHWTQIKTDQSYKTVFVGTPVEFDIPNKGTASNVIPLERVDDTTGKSLMLVAYADMRYQIPMEELHHRISRFGSAGLRHLNERNGFLISTDKDLNSEEATELYNIIISNHDLIEEAIGKGLRKVIHTSDYKYDIIFL